MRSAFVEAITQAAADDDRVMLLVGDLGYKLFDEFDRRFPGRYLNVGVSEANMTTMAAGLALEGFRPFTYSIVPFASLRCLEQIRNDVCQMQLSVTVVGVGAGYAYGINGPTHHGVDDLGAMRSLAGMTVISPCDPRETTQAMTAILKREGPAYLRLGRNGEPLLEGTDGPFTIGVPRILREGTGLAILATGSVAGEALRAADDVRRDGVDPLVLSVHTLKPLEGLGALLKARDIRQVLTVEEHGPHGGLFEAVCGALATDGSMLHVKRAGAPDAYIHEANHQKGMREYVGVHAGALVETIRALLGSPSC